MPTISELVEMSRKAEADKAGQTPPAGPTAEQINAAAVAATMQDLREKGLLRDAPVSPTGSEQHPNGTPDNITWATLDVTTPEGKAAYEAWLQTPDAKQPLAL